MPPTPISSIQPRLQTSTEDLPRKAWRILTCTGSKVNRDTRTVYHTALEGQKNGELATIPSLGYLQQVRLHNRDRCKFNCPQPKRLLLIIDYIFYTNAVKSPNAVILQDKATYKSREGRSQKNFKVLTAELLTNHTATRPAFPSTNHSWS